MQKGGHKNNLINALSMKQLIVLIITIQANKSSCYIVIIFVQ